MKIVHGSLSTRIYHSLKDSLIEGNYEPGQRLTMQELAEDLGTSVTPVREACLRLVSEMALELRSGRFATVPELSVDRYRQIKAIRISLESLAAELATEFATAADITTLRELHGNFVASERQANHPETRKFNREFHFHVYRLSGMPMLVAQIENLWASMGPILHVYYTEVENDYLGAEEHEALIQAFVDGDAKAAGKAIERDILRGGLDLMRYFESRGVVAE